MAENWWGWGFQGGWYLTEEGKNCGGVKTKVGTSQRRVRELWHVYPFRFDLSGSSDACQGLCYTTSLLVTIWSDLTVRVWADILGLLTDTDACTLYIFFIRGAEAPLSPFGEPMTMHLGCHIFCPQDFAKKYGLPRRLIPNKGLKTILPENVLKKETSSSANLLKSPNGCDVTKRAIIHMIILLILGVSRLG